MSIEREYEGCLTAIPSLLLAVGTVFYTALGVWLAWGWLISSHVETVPELPYLAALGIVACWNMIGGSVNYIPKDDFVEMFDLEFEERVLYLGYRYLTVTMQIALAWVVQAVL